MQNINIITSRRAVLEALNSGTPIDKIALRTSAKGDIIGKIIASAKSRNIRIDRLPPEVFDRQFKSKDTAGVAAWVSEIRTVELEDILSSAENKLESPFIVILDGIEDPHNLGAIARSAEGAGCHGIVIAQRRSAPLSAAAVNSSSGALMHVPVARVGNLADAIKRLKKSDVWVFGADMNGEDHRICDYPPAIALVVGAEGRGLSKNIRGLCDKIVSIPLKGKIESLNASVSAGILMFDIASKRE